MDEPSADKLPTARHKAGIQILSAKLWAVWTISSFKTIAKGNYNSATYRG